MRDEETLDRIASLAIPPAWTDVWICPSSRGHIQATGRDAKGRKQYRYHPRYRRIRNRVKFDRMLSFASALPKIRDRIESDLAMRGMSRQKIVATVVRLLETTLIRVGNETYARHNGSFGLTTMRNRHVAIDGSTVRFRFRGKSGVCHEVELHDRRLARIVRRCRELPGHLLFEYVDDDGELRTVCSEDVNDYLHEVGGEEFTVKDFRTWGGTVLAVAELGGQEPIGGEIERKRAVVEAVRRVAKHLGNRPATCRNYYIHPAVVDAFMAGTLYGIYRTACDDSGSRLTRAEAATVALLGGGS